MTFLQLENSFGNLALMKADAVVSKRRQSNDFTKKKTKNPAPHQIICRDILTLFGGGIAFKRLFIIIVKETLPSSIKTEF